MKEGKMTKTLSTIEARPKIRKAQQKLKQAVAV